MTEFSSMLVEIGRHLIQRPSPEKRSRRSHELAREAVLLYANTAQEPIQTFSANSPSEFDLTKLAPGSLFRMKISSGKGQVNHHWFVVGLTENAVPDVYQVEMDTDLRTNLDHERLLLGPNWKILKKHVTATSFPVSQTKVALWGMKVESAIHDWIPPEKIDLMSAGTKKKAVVRKAVSRYAATLIPLPVGNKK